MNKRGGAVLRAVLAGLLVGLAIGGAFAAGFLAREISGLGGRVLAEGAGGEFPLLGEVETLIERNFVRPRPSQQTLEYGAIRGLLAALGDPFTFFIEPPVAASESDVLAGTYGGIGVQVARTEAGVLVLYPFDDSPALQAGIQAGDVLLAVNGVVGDVTMQADALDQMLRGEVREGSGVTLRVQAQGGEARDIFVPFAVINVPSVAWRVLAEDSRLGYVQILRFTSRTPDELAAAVDALRGQGAQALVVDLRGTAGGLLQESIQVADAFIDEGVIVMQRNTAGERTFTGTPGGAAVDLSVALLVNHGTASGAELVAGALQDRGRAMLIGQRTYGKGTVQQIFPLSDGSSLHVTSSEWFTPERQALDGAGLQPDVEMQPDAQGRDVELAEAVRRLADALGE